MQTQSNINANTIAHYLRLCCAFSTQAKNFALPVKKCLTQGVGCVLRAKVKTAATIASSNSSSFLLRLFLIFGTPMWAKNRFSQNLYLKDL